MIRTFKDARTKAVFEGRCLKGLPGDVFGAARRKLAYLNAAERLEDLKAPPGNKLHPLRKDRAGQHAVWINGQYRLCFRWTEVGPEDVEIVDYH